MTAVWASRHEALVSHAVVSRFHQIAWWRASILRVVYLDLAGNSTAPKTGYNAPLSHRYEGALP